MYSFMEEIRYALEILSLKAKILVYVQLTVIPEINLSYILKGKKDMSEIAHLTVPCP